MVKGFYTKRIISFGIAAGAIIVLLAFKNIQDTFLISIKKSLEWQPLYYIIIALSLLIGLYYSFYFAKHSKSKEIRLLFKVFGPLIDPPANTLAYGIVISSVLRLVKGLFNQFFFEIEYFRDFGFINVSAIALACIPLLIWSINGLVQYFNVIFIKGGKEIGEVTAKLDEG